VALKKWAQNQKKILFLLISLLIIGIFNLQSQEKRERDKITIITSIFPLQEFAKAVAGEKETRRREEDPWAES